MSTEVRDCALKVIQLMVGLLVRWSVGQESQKRDVSTMLDMTALAIVSDETP